MGNAYVKGKLAPDVDEAHHHVMPVKTYLAVFAGLMFLTVLTVLVSYADLGSAALPVAMAVAFIKAGFVIGYFMHLKYDTSFHAFVFFGSIVFVAIFFLITFLDINTRDATHPEWGNHAWARDQGKDIKPDPEEIEIPAEKLAMLRAKVAAGESIEHGGEHGAENGSAHGTEAETPEEGGH